MFCVTFSVRAGCRNALVNLEARSLNGWSTSRHCVVTLLQNLTVDHFRDIRAKAGGLLIILPRDISELNTEEKQVGVFRIDFSDGHDFLFSSAIDGHRRRYAR